MYVLVSFRHIVELSSSFHNVDSGSQYYRQPTVQNVNAGDFIRGINSKSGAVSISALPTATSNYQVYHPSVFNDR